MVVRVVFDPLTPATRPSPAIWLPVAVNEIELAVPKMLGVCTVPAVCVTAPLVVSSNTVDAVSVPPSVISPEPARRSSACPEIEPWTLSVPAGL